MTMVTASAEGIVRPYLLPLRRQADSGRVTELTGYLRRQRHE